MSEAFEDAARAVPANSQAEVGSKLQDEVVHLFDQFRERLLRYLVALGLDMQDAEEVVQEVFLALFRHLQHERSNASLRGWIFRVAHNIGLKRRKSYRQGAALTESEIDPAPGPEQQAIEAERQRRLRSVVRALPEIDRCCLYLRAEGLRYREIAGVLGISLGTVSGTLARSLARLTRVDGR